MPPRSFQTCSPISKAWRWQSIFWSLQKAVESQPLAVCGETPAMLSTEYPVGV